MKITLLEQKDVVNGRSSLPHDLERPLVGMSNELLEALGNTYEKAVRKENYRTRMTFEAYARNHIFQVINVQEGDLI